MTRIVWLFKTEEELHTKNLRIFYNHKIELTPEFDSIIFDTFPSLAVHIYVRRLVGAHPLYCSLDPKKKKNQLEKL